MTGVGNKILSSLTTLLGRDVPESVSSWLEEASGFETIKNDADAQELSDAELYELAQKLLEQAEEFSDLEAIKQYEEIAEAIFEAIALHEEPLDIEEDEKNTEVADQVQEFVDLSQAIKDDLESDDEIDNLGVTSYLDNVTPETLPTVLATLSPEEQANVIAYYQNDYEGDNQEALLEAAINAVPLTSLDDVIAVLYADSDNDLAKTIIETRLNNADNTTDKTNIITTLFDRDSAFATMEASDRANLVADTVDIIQQQTADNEALTTAFRDALNQQSDFEDDIIEAVSNYDPDNSDLKQFLGFLKVPDISLDDISSTSLNFLLSNALNDDTAQGTKDAENLVNDIIRGRDKDSFDVKDATKEVLQGFIDDDDPATLDRAAFKDFLDEILSNNAHLTNEEYKAVLDALKQFDDELKKNQLIPNNHNFLQKQANGISIIFNRAVEDVYPPELTRLNNNEPLDSITLDTSSIFNVSTEDLGKITNILDDTDDDKVTKLENGSHFDALLLSLQDNKISSGDKELIAQAIIKKALQSAGNLEKLHHLLQFFPDLLDNFEEIAENNPNHPIVNFLTSPYKGNENYKDNDYDSIFTTLEDQEEQFLAIFTDGVNGKISDNYVDNVDLSDAQLALYGVWNNDDATEEERNDAFADYFSDNETDRISALTDFNSDFYDSLSNKEDFFVDLLDWLVNEGSTSDKQAFFNSIEPFSELHLALIKIANDALDTYPDSDFGKALQSITNDIAKGEGVSSSDVKDVFDDDGDTNLSEYAGDIFTYIEDFEEENTISPEIQDFITQYGTTINSQEDVNNFLSGLSPFEAERFFTSLLAEDSLLFASGKDINEIMEYVLTALSSDSAIEEPLKTQLQRQFLASASNNTILLAVFQDLGLDIDILDAIEDEELDEIEDADINRFFNPELNTAIQTWLNSDLIEGYIDDLNAAEAYDNDAIQDILEQAEDDGYLQVLLSQIFADDSDLLNDSTLLALFDWFDKSGNRDQRDKFFENLSPNSTFSKALQTLIDSETEPFDDISYSVDSDTGKVTFSPLNKLVEIIEDKDSEASFLLLDEIGIQQDIKIDRENSEGADNASFRRLVSQIQNGEDIDFTEYFAPEIDSDGDEDFSNAEELIEFILADDNYLFSSLNNTQLKNFMENFIDFLRNDADDELLETFFDELDTDSVLGKALVAAGLELDELDDAEDASDYKKVLGDIQDYDAFINVIETNNNLADYNGDVITLMSSSLRGLSDKGNITDAVDKILDVAFYDSQTLEDLLNEVLNGGPAFIELSPEQAEILMTRLFARIRDEKSEDRDSLSPSKEAFLNILKRSDFYKDHIEADRAHKALADYIEGDDDDISTSNLDRALNKLLRDKNAIDDFTEDNTGENDGAKSSSNYNIDDSVLDEDEENFFKDDVIIDGYGSIASLYGRSAIKGERGRLSENFLDETNQSPDDIGIEAANADMSLDEVAGIIALMSPEEAADFIEAFLSNGGGQDNDTVTFLLGQLMLYQIDGDIDDDHFEDILYEIDDSNNEMVEEYFDDYSILDLTDTAIVRQATMTGWKDTAEDKTNYGKNFINTAISDVSEYVDPTPQQSGPPAWAYQKAHAVPFGMYEGGGVLPGMGTMGGGYPPPIAYPSAQTLYMRGFMDGYVQGALGGSPSAINPGGGGINIVINL